MKQNFAIVGLGRFGGSICRTLIEAGQEVLAIDSNEDRVNEYMNIATHAVVANAQDEISCAVEVFNKYPAAPASMAG